MAHVIAASAAQFNLQGSYGLSFLLAWAALLFVCARRLPTWKRWAIASIVVLLLTLPGAHWFIGLVLADALLLAVLVVTTFFRSSEDSSGDEDPGDKSPGDHDEEERG